MQCSRSHGFCRLRSSCTSYATPFLGLLLTFSPSLAHDLQAQNNVTKHSKRSLTSALVIGFGGIGGIIASTVYRQADFPGYFPGLWTTIALQFFTIAACVGLGFYFKKQNALAERGEKILEDTPGFRYTI